MKLTALIPAYNDAYTLGLCLASIVDHFDEIIVLDDASTDDTPQVASDFARGHSRVRVFCSPPPQLGWVQARNRLAALTDSDHLFWLDADDVLCEYQADELRRLAESKRALVRLRLAEMWGDLYHTTQRLRHQDRCHLYVNRRRFKDLIWGGTAAARPDAEPIPGASVQATVTDRVLLFHLKGVKPDYRLVQRQHVRGWLRMKARRPDRRPDRLTDRLGGMSSEEMHALALKMLLHSRQDKLRPTYLPDAFRPTSPELAWPGPPEPRFRGEGWTGSGGGAPKRPRVIERALPGRFRILYNAEGQPIDRIDTEVGDVSSKGRR